MLILPHCWESAAHELSGEHAGARLSREAQGHSASPSATVLHSRIHICGIIIEDKYYQVQSERALCIYAGATESGALKLNTARGSWLWRSWRGGRAGANSLLCTSMATCGNIRVKGQGGWWWQSHTEDCVWKGCLNTQLGWMNEQYNENQQV